MKTPVYPLRFYPTYKDYLWGGDWIIRKYRRPMTPGVYAESWEVSDREDGMSMVSNGVWAGLPFKDLLKKHHTALLGPSAATAALPLLIKLIDARERLSVQVHPDDAAAARYGGEAKTEMWYVLDATPDAGVYAGFKPGVTPEQFEQALRDKTVADLLQRHPVRPGDAVFIPGGRVHAIDAGCLLLEVQQNSNTTYRIYDWDRVDAEGNARPLHLDAARQVINWNDSVVELLRPSLIGEGKGWTHHQILDCPLFRMEKLSLNAAWTWRRKRPGFAVLFLQSGELDIIWSGRGEPLMTGDSAFLPAALSELQLHPLTATAEVLLVDIP